MSNEHMIIALWSAPRSLSTAFLRMMLERGDMIVFSEPFCDIRAKGVYTYTKDGTVCRSDGDVIEIIFNARRTSNVFFKDTCEYPMTSILHKEAFMRKVTHSFIVRDLTQTINSHYAVETNVCSDEIGYKHLHEIFMCVKEALGRTPVIVDADQLALNPRDAVRGYCESVNIPYMEQALTWNSGHVEEWRSTEIYHQDVSKTTGFSPTNKRYKVTVDNDEFLQYCYLQNKPYFDAIWLEKYRSKAP
jgi:hypothetical protein